MALSRLDHGQLGMSSKGAGTGEPLKALEQGREQAGAVLQVGSSGVGTTGTAGAGKFRQARATAAALTGKTERREKRNAEAGRQEP